MATIPKVLHEHINFRRKKGFGVLIQVERAEDLDGAALALD